MARDEDDDLYDEEFDFVDDDDDEAFEAESDADAEAASDGMATSASGREERDDRDRDEPKDRQVADTSTDDESVDEYGRPAPKTDYVVHIYEHRKFKRTIDRPFTPEDAEAFASEYNRTAKSYGRVAVSGKNDAKPKKALD
jgi:hypothetical protein